MAANLRTDTPSCPTRMTRTKGDRVRKFEREELERIVLDLVNHRSKPVRDAVSSAVLRGAVEVDPFVALIGTVIYDEIEKSAACGEKEGMGVDGFRVGQGWDVIGIEGEAGAPQVEGATAGRFPSASDFFEILERETFGPSRRLMRIYRGDREVGSSLAWDTAMVGLRKLRDFWVDDGMASEFYRIEESDQGANAGVCDVVDEILSEIARDIVQVGQGRSEAGVQARNSDVVKARLEEVRNIQGTLRVSLYAQTLCPRDVWRDVDIDRQSSDPDELEERYEDAEIWFSDIGFPKTIEVLGEFVARRRGETCTALSKPENAQVDEERARSPPERRTSPDADRAKSVSVELQTATPTDVEIRTGEGDYATSESEVESGPAAAANRSLASQPEGFPRGSRKRKAPGHTAGNQQRTPKCQRRPANRRPSTRARKRASTGKRGVTFEGEEEEDDDDGELEVRTTKKIKKALSVCGNKIRKLIREEEEEEEDQDEADAEGGEEESEASSEDGEYDVEAILRRQKRIKRGTSKRVTHYLIKWQGYAEKDNTWEPEENVGKSTIDAYIFGKDGWVIGRAADEDEDEEGAHGESLEAFTHIAKTVQYGRTGGGWGWGKSSPVCGRERLQLGFG